MDEINGTLSESKYINMVGTITIPTEIRVPDYPNVVDTTVLEDEVPKPEDILEGKVVFANGQKIVGTLPEYTHYEEVTRICPTGGFNVHKNTIYRNNIEILVNMDSVNADLIPRNIRSGVKIRYNPYAAPEVIGTFTDGATALPEDVRKGKIFYAKGTDMMGTLEEITIDDAWSRLTFGSNIPTHGRKVEVVRIYGEPVVRLYMGDVFTRTVSVPEDGSLFLNDSTEYQCTSFTVATVNSYIVPSSVEEARTSVDFRYVTE